MKRRTRVLLGVFFLVGIFWAANVLIERHNSVALADGTLLSLADIKVGFTNTFWIGSRISRLFAFKNGSHFVTENSGSEEMWLHFKLNSASELLDLSNASVNHRVLIYRDSDKFPYANEFYKRGPNAWPNRQNFFVRCEIWPRDAETFRIEVQSRSNSESPWKTISSFERENPKKNTAEPSTLSGLNKQANPYVKTEINTPIVCPERPNSPAVWTHKVLIPVRVSDSRRPGWEWKIRTVFTQDELGNKSIWTHQPAEVDPATGWSFIDGWRPVSIQSQWKVTVNYCPDASKQTNYLSRVQIPLPITNGFNFELETHVLKAVRDGSLVILSITNHPPSTELDLIQILDPAGDSVPFDSWSMEGSCSFKDVSERSWPYITLVLAVVPVFSETSLVTPSVQDSSIGVHDLQRIYQAKQ